MRVSLIVAVSENGVIGRDGGLPWRLSKDLSRFKQLTMGHHLVIGRRTWEEVGTPLPGRIMVVVTRDRTFAADGVLVAHSLDEALDLVRDDDEPFIGGGAEIYRMALERSMVDCLYITRVHAEVEGDTFFPEIDLEAWRLISREDHEADDRNQYPFSFLVYNKV
ncbi:MAG: dihydrofolate reductase [Acidobacteriota bacterium]